ncbi:pentapeptide repeat-containing protein [Actinomyces sp. W5033]|uniref:pentapeptide repeat-containing protein n=1 Tax=Actinomyces sp. W5033 TaxID=3446479 RepID=UPI003EDFAAB4
MSSKRGEKADTSNRNRSTESHVGSWPLFWTILLWVVLALAVFTVLGWLWGEGPSWSWQRWLTNWRSAGDKAGPLDIVKVSLTTIGGIGGTGYLVIKYRERASAERAERAAELARKDIEQEKAEQKLLNAVQQLGSESPQVRIAGVYALADVADTYRGGYRQRVVNILCGYLRTPRGTWETITDTNTEDGETTSEKVYVSNDGAVESTVLEVLSRHLRKRREKTDTHGAVTQDVDDDQLWCDCTIGLHDAVITESLNFTGVTLASDVSFQGATFNTFAIFRGASFDAHVTFRGATFNANTSFWDTTFNANTSFQESTFNADTFFWGATFNANTSFQESTFNANTNFWGATFNTYTFFWGATFNANTSFWDTTFNYDAHLERATFNRSAGPTGIPRELVDDETGLPEGARWARCNDKGEVIEEGSPEPDKPSDAAGSS